VSYRTRDQLLSDFYNLETIYPNLISHESIGKSTGGRDIPLFKIGNPSGGRVMFVGGTHGGEAVGPEVHNKYAHWLLERKEPAICDRILARNYTLIVPIFNVDNYPVTRKNANGVDLNRNFSKSWRTDCTILGNCVSGVCPTGQVCIDGYCYKSGCACYWSDDPTKYNYRGPAPKSEPETNVMLNTLNKYKPKFFLDCHIWDGPMFGKPSARAGVTSADNIKHDEIAQKIINLASQRGVAAYGYTSIGVCGSLLDDAYATGNAISFLLEAMGKINGANTLPPYADVTTIYFPRFLPFAIVMSDSAAVTVSPINILILAGVGYLLYLAFKK